jgi:hypothetical protein
LAQAAAHARTWLTSACTPKAAALSAPTASHFIVLIIVTSRVWLEKTPSKTVAEGLPVRQASVIPHI